MACQIVFRTLKRIEKLIVPNMKTIDINQEIAHLIREEGAEPAFLGYRGYPRESCISVNETVVHGIPGQRKLREGDIVSIDIGVLKDGFYGDAASSYPVGRIDQNKDHLLKVTKAALEEGIKQTIAGNRISDISAAIEDTVSREGCSPVRDLVGHGIGRNLHEDPQVPNFRSKDAGCRIQDGMVLAIEPMINMGGYEVETLDDEWTVVTRDGKPSAHYEHTVAVIDGKAQILSIDIG